jgi:hypothetical protein
MVLTESSSAQSFAIIWSLHTVLQTEKVSRFWKSVVKTY